MEMPKTRNVPFFGTSKNGVTPNLTSNSDSPSYIYPKTGQTRFLLHGNVENPQCSIFWNIKKRRHTKSHLKFGFPVLNLP